MIKKYSAHSKKWFMEWSHDCYVQQARKINVRSRAWFKLHEIDRMDILLSSGMTVIDLGASPGSWSQYARQKIGCHGSIAACDIMPMDAILGVNFLQGDVCKPEVIATLMRWMHGRTADVILSDMSPNITGITDVDTFRSMYLAQLALNICRFFLVIGGSFLVKIFQGNAFDKYLDDIRSVFEIVKIRKPRASRIHSREIYIVAKGYKI